MVCLFFVLLFLKKSWTGGRETTNEQMPAQTAGHRANTAVHGAAISDVPASDANFFSL